ncbi:hypothetical protein Vadar_030653 [Vaccinium darrowii]|uniref:Uncharacterized protein n=1 Tax=Vaccinium darrowii TaxID=229202 RepID=A0ACB7Y3S2_9ERIC|nr:hypothetical protein Vadar_030653 [Vaccinium darrowii]
MAMKRVASTTIQALSSSNSLVLTRRLHASPGSKKIVGVFYKANEYASMNPNFVGCAEGALGIRDWLESKGHQYIVTDDKDGPNCELEKHIPDMHVLIPTPFHPAYLTADRIKRAKNLQLVVTAGIGSDHVDLKAAAAAGLTVAEVTGSNTQSVAEDQLMRILILVRNFLPGYHQVVNGEWNVAAIAHRLLTGNGMLLLLLIEPMILKGRLLGPIKMDSGLESETGAKFEEDLDAMLPKCDIVVTNLPLTEKTKGMFDKERIAKLKKGVLIVNNSRGALMDTQAVVDACTSGHIAGYSGDVWYPQPAPKDHPWRYMPNQAMTPHVSGTTIDAQLRYAAGVKDMLERSLSLILSLYLAPPRRSITYKGMAETKSAMRKPVFTKVDQLRPGTSGHNLTVKVVSANMVLQKGRPDGPQVRQMRIAECLIGDETGTILFTARNDQVDLMKPDSTVILRNAKIDMFKGSMRLAVDKWGRVEVTEPASFTVNEENNLSLVEYELVNVVEE